MRISPVGYLSNDLTDIMSNSYNATYPSHNSDEALYYANIISKVIYYSMRGLDKNNIKYLLGIKYEYKPFTKFNITCEETMNNCLYALFESNSFEEAVKKVISFGGDTDTNAAIVGSMAEAVYGIDNNLINLAKEKIPEDFTKKLSLAYSKINK